MRVRTSMLQSTLTHDCSVEHAGQYAAQNKTTVQNCTVLKKIVVLIWDGS